MSKKLKGYIEDKSYSYGCIECDLKNKCTGWAGDPKKHKNYFLLGYCTMLTVLKINPKEWVETKILKKWCLLCGALPDKDKCCPYHNFKIVYPVNIQVKGDHVK